MLMHISYIRMHAGAAIVTSVDACRDQYITREEWLARGPQTIREKCGWNYLEHW